MINHYDNLIRARNSLHDPEYVMSCLRVFEEDILSGKVSDEEVQRCLAIISDISSFSQAASEGIASARQLIVDSLQPKISLETYDSAGKKLVSKISKTTATRF